MKHPATSLFADSRLSRVANDLADLLQPAIRLKTFPCREDELPLGATRIGGRPDVPASFVWPVWNSSPLAFLAQINLHDLSQFSCAQVLPTEGWLLFFYDAEQTTWGFDPADKGSWATLFIPPYSAQLVRRGVAADPLRDGFYHLCRVETAAIITAMPQDSPAIARLKLSAAEQDAYDEFLEELDAAEGVHHQLLGHPQPIQGDMQLECQLVANGLYCGDPTGYRHPKARQLAKGAKDWMLLLQLDTDDSAGMMWGDVGKLYFWINQKHPGNQTFDQSWMILQCY